MPTAKLAKLLKAIATCNAHFTLRLWFKNSSWLIRKLMGTAPVVQIAARLALWQVEWEVGVLGMKA